MMNAEICVCVLMVMLVPSCVCQSKMVKEEDPKDPKFKQYATFAVKELKNKVKDHSERRLVSVLKAESARDGKKHLVVLLMAKHDCDKQHVCLAIVEHSPDMQMTYWSCSPEQKDLVCDGWDSSSS